MVYGHTILVHPDDRASDHYRGKGEMSIQLVNLQLLLWLELQWLLPLYIRHWLDSLTNYSLHDENKYKQRTKIEVNSDKLSSR